MYFVWFSSIPTSANTYALPTQPSKHQALVPNPVTQPAVFCRSACLGHALGSCAGTCDKLVGAQNPESVIMCAGKQLPLTYSRPRTCSGSTSVCSATPPTCIDSKTGRPLLELPASLRRRSSCKCPGFEFGFQDTEFEDRFLFRWRVVGFGRDLYSCVCCMCAWS